MLWLRALAAAGLSLVFPGAGHALLRDWVRAGLFASLFVATTVFFVPVHLVTPEMSVGEVSRIVVENTAEPTQFLLAFLALFCAIDAGVCAVGAPQGANRADDAPTCPSCGEPLDEELSFCHWCTTRLESTETGE